MSEIALASINSFGSKPSKADFVPPSEQLITLTIGQLQDLITQTVEKAIQSHKDEVSELRAIVVCQDEKIASLEAAASLQEENQLIQLRLINDLREAIKKDPQPLQKDRGDILRALLAANGGKLPEKIARQKMRMSKQAFTNLLATVDEIESVPLRTDKRQRLLVLK